MLSTTLCIASQAHDGQKDKGGYDYIWHPIAVAMLCKSDNAKIVAILHDVIEDTSTTLQDLANNGFSQEIINAVDCMSKTKGESVESYQKRIASNDLAIEVKFADMLHNSDLKRLKDPVVSEENCLKYYRRMITLSDITKNKLATINPELYNQIIAIINEERTRL